MKNEMKKNYWKVSLIFSMLPALAAGQVAETDTTRTYNLEESVVQAATVIRKPDKNIYMVSESLSERSASALDLLQNVRIPELTVNPVMETVVSSLGSVQIRINGREASVEKLQSIDPKNIQKIEWIDNPGLRYGTTEGAVLNVIVKNPTAGGSLNLAAGEGLTVFFNNSRANLTLNEGRSQWTVGVRGSFRGKLEMFREYQDSYLLPDGTRLDRRQEPLPGFFNQNYVTPGISYNYVRPDTTNFYIGLDYVGKYGELSRFDGLLTSSASSEVLHLRDEEGGTDRTPGLSVYWEQKLRNDQTLVFNSFTQFSGGTSFHRYQEYADAAVPGIDIENHIRFRNGYYSLEGNYIKEWEKAGQLTTGLKYSGSSSRSAYLDYDGRTVRQNLDRVYAFGEYKQTVKKWTFTAGLGGTWVCTSLADSGTRDASFNFSPRLSVNWRASDKSRWTATYSNFVGTPSLTMTSPVTQEIDGIQIQRGNPDVHAYMRHWTNLRYNYSNNRNFTLTMAGKFTYFPNPIQTCYSWEGDYILRSYSNEGYYKDLGLSATASWDVVPEWLSLSANLNYSHEWNEGRNFRHKIDALGQSFSASVYHWGFALDFEFHNPAESLWGEELTRGERFNIIALSYHWKNWNFSALVFQPFGKYSQKTEILSELVSQKTILRSHSIECMPMLQISYNLNWGHQKRVAARKLSDSGEASATTAAGR